MNTKRKYDIQCPGIKPGTYQHFAKEPNTNYLGKETALLRERHVENEDRRNAEINRYKKDELLQKYEKHASKKQFQRLVKEKVQKKMEAYEEEVEKRRKKLHELLCNEERQFYYETVQKAQNYDDVLMEDKKRKLELLRAKKEEERLAVVHQKRIEQYRERCEDLRKYLIKKHLKETKDSQLQQIREHECNREAEKELDRMWHHLMMKDVRAKMEREEQDALREKLNQKDLLDTWDKQMTGKRLLKSEIERLANEEKLEMEKLQDQLRREEIEALDAKRRKRDQMAEDLLNQIAEQEMFLEKRRQEDEAYTSAFVKMSEIEMENEKQAVKDFTAVARKETLMYRNYLKELEIERKNEEQELERLLEFHRKAVEKKQDEARCKLIAAKRALQENVLQERAEQIAYKKEEAEQQLKLKQVENELLRMAFEQNERLQAESDRLEAEAVKLYREDLKKQIEYNKILRERERQELERQLQEGIKEEEKYRKIVEVMLTGNMESSQVHPFKRVMDKTECHCKYP